MTSSGLVMLEVEVVTDEMATHKWAYTKATNGDKTQLGDKVSKVKGVPYAWGRMDSTGAVGGSFDALVKAGKYIGNVAEVSASGTIGVDCSGFVSVTFSIPKIQSNGLIG
jgi:cell wall-associated NlpC family hydrolase